MPWKRFFVRMVDGIRRHDAAFTVFSYPFRAFYAFPILEDRVLICTPGFGTGTRPSPYMGNVIKHQCRFFDGRR